MSRTYARSGGGSPRRRRIGAIGIVMVAVAARVATAQTPAGEMGTGVETLTIEQAVQEALGHNFDLIAKRADIRVADAAMVTARLRQNPVFSFDADHLDWLGTGFNDVNAGGPTEIGWRVDVPLERGGKRDLRIEDAADGRTVADAQVADAERTLRLTVELACVDVLQATENLALTRDTLRTFEDLAALNAERVRAGAAAPSEAVRTNVAMMQFRANLSRAELDLRAASIRLRQLLGRPASSEPLSVLAAPLAVAAATPDLAALEAMALQHRPDYRAAKLTEARTAADLRLQIAQGKVDFSWGAEYRRQAGPIGKSNSVGLFFSTPLPLANRNQGEIAHAQIEQDRAAVNASGADLAVRADVCGAFEAFQSSGVLVASIEHDLLGPAQQARDTAEYTYRARATTLVELIDSQRAWNDAQQTYHDAQADYRRALARLNASVGMEVVR